MNAGMRVLQRSINPDGWKPVNKESRERILTSLCVSSFFGLTLFLFGPAHLYFTNIQEYSIPFFKVVPFLLGLSVLCVLLLTALLVSAGPQTHRKAVSLLFVLSLLLWLQGNIFVWNYGPLDGREIDWSANRVRGLIDGGIWVGLIIIAFAAAPRVWKIARGAGIAFLLIQLASLLIVLAKAPDVSHLQKETALDEESLYGFSPERNVIILVLDSFQADIFQEIINESPRYWDVFDGFTFFRNSLAGYPVTHANVPLILTGRYYENSVPIHEFVKEAFSGDSVPKILMNNGYRVDLFVAGKYAYTDETIASSRIEIKNLSDRNSSLREAAFLLDITLFRYLPHFVKRYVYNNQAWFLHNLGLDRVAGGAPPGPFGDSIIFIRKMAGKANDDCDKKTFKYIHLWPPHLPIRINERLEYEDLEGTRDNFKKQAKGSLELVNVIFEAFRRLGIYDNTMILVIADHGAHYKINTETIGHKHDNDKKESLIDEIKPTAIPLFLIKPFMSTGKLTVSDAPVSLADVAETIVSELSLEADVPGTSVFMIGESDIRNRRYLYHESGHDWPRYYLSPMTEYSVSGFSWLNESWSPTHKVFDAGGPGTSPAHAADVGTNIDFGIEGEYLKYQGHGWSYPEEGFTWTDGKNASLIIPIGRRVPNIEVKVTFKPFLVSDKVERQRIKVFVNGLGSGEWIVTEDVLHEQSLFILNNGLTNGSAKISFELPDAASPVELGIGDDERELGICMYSLELYEADAIPETLIYKWGTPIQFGVGGDYSKYQGKGWSLPERNITWTSGKSASLIMPIDETEADIELKARLSPFIVPDKLDMQRVVVFVNGNKVGEWSVKEKEGIWNKVMRKDMFHERTILIPNNLLEDSVMVVTFELPDAASPAKMGLRGDSRILGVAMHSVVLTESNTVSEN